MRTHRLPITRSRPSVRPVLGQLEETARVLTPSVQTVSHTRRIHSTIPRKCGRLCQYQDILCIWRLANRGTQRKPIFRLGNKYLPELKFIVQGVVTKGEQGHLTVGSGVLRLFFFFLLPFGSLWIDFTLRYDFVL